MKVLAYILTILLFQLPFTDTMGQVNKVFDKEEKKSSQLPTYKGSSPSSSAVLMNSYFSKREQSVDKYCKDIDENEQVQLDSIVIQLKNADPNSYEYHYVNYVNSNHDKMLLVIWKGMKSLPTTSYSMSLLLIMKSPTMPARKNILSAAL